MSRIRIGNCQVLKFFQDTVILKINFLNLSKQGVLSIKNHLFLGCWFGKNQTSCYVCITIAERVISVT